MSEPRALTADERQQIAIGQFGMGDIHALLDRSAFLESERETLTARLREAERLIGQWEDLEDAAMAFGQAKPASSETAVSDIVTGRKWKSVVTAALLFWAIWR